jgi:hypothetical protein
MTRPAQLFPDLALFLRSRQRCYDKDIPIHETWRHKADHARPVITRSMTDGRRGPVPEHRFQLFGREQTTAFQRMDELIDRGSHRGGSTRHTLESRTEASQPESKHTLSEI